MKSHHVFFASAAKSMMGKGLFTGGPQRPPFLFYKLLVIFLFNITIRNQIWAKIWDRSVKTPVLFFYRISETTSGFPGATLSVHRRNYACAGHVLSRYCGRNKSCSTDAPLLYILSSFAYNILNKIKQEVPRLFRRREHVTN